MMQPEWIIRSPELREILARRPDSISLIDVREPEEFEAARIEGAKLIPLGELSSRMHEISRDKPVVLFCAHGVRSMHALRALQAQGYTKLQSLDGGISDYLGIP